MKTGKPSNKQESLCISCGICCNGTLFGKVPLVSGDDIQLLQKGGIKILLKGEKRSFALGCSAYKNSCCQIYDARPQSCIKFRCDLLKAFESGEISWSDSREKIVRVRQLSEKLRKEILENLPEHENLSVPALRRFSPEHSQLAADPILLKKWSTVLMLMAVISDLLRTDFRSSGKNKEKPSAEL